MTFQHCDFADNRFKGIPAETALITGNSVQNHLVVTDSSFARNDMLFNNSSVSGEYLVPCCAPLIPVLTGRPFFVAGTERIFDSVERAGGAVAELL